MTVVPNGTFLRVVLLGIGLTTCKPAPTPSVAGSVKQKPDDDVDLDMQERRPYRGVVGSLQCLPVDRCDVQFETTARAKKMKQPTNASRTQLTWLARYLAVTQSVRIVFIKPGSDNAPHEACLRVWSDNETASNVKERKSQSRLEG